MDLDKPTIAILAVLALCAAFLCTVLGLTWWLGL